MTEFFQAVAQYPWLRSAIIAGVLASVACGIVGTYVLVRRITYIAGGIAHCALGGLGAAVYLRATYGWQWMHPLYGAVASAILAALIIGVVSLRTRQREDTVISALWAIGMATGVMFIYKTPGFQQDLLGYLFGNILMVSRENLWLIGGLDIVVVVVGLVFYNQFQAICFDEEFARLRGLRVEFYYLLLLCLTALTVVLLVTVVGIVMVIALLTIPIAVATYFSRTLLGVMGLSMIFSVLFTGGGLALSYGPNLPSGATIIILSGTVYFLVAIAARWRRAIKK